MSSRPVPTAASVERRLGAPRGSSGRRWIMSLIRPMGDEVAQLDERRQQILQHWSSGEDNPLLSFYVKVMTKMIGAERCSIFISDPSSGLIWLKCGTELQERAIEVQAEGSIVGDVIRTGAPVRFEHLEEREGVHKNIDEATGFVTRSVLCVPIRTLDGERVAGAVQLLNKIDGEFTVEDQAELEEMAHYLQLSIENIYFNQEMSGALDRAVRFAAVAGFSVIATVVIAATALIVYWVGFTAVAT
jgi:GAF domain-containing protein